MHAHVPRGATDGRDSVHGCVRGGRFLGHLHWAGDEFDTGNGQMMCLQRTERGLVRAPTTERGLDRAPTTERGLDRAPTSQHALLPQATDRTRELVGRWPRPHAFRACRRQFLGGRPRRAHVASAPPSGVRGGGGWWRRILRRFREGVGGLPGAGGAWQHPFFLTGGWVGVARPRSSRANEWARQRSRMCSRWQNFGPPALGR